MTENEFIQAAASFSPGDMVVVSGPDEAAIGALLDQVQAEIESGGKTVWRHDSREVSNDNLGSSRSFKPRGRSTWLRQRSSLCNSAARPSRPNARN